ncbi:DsrE family protein [Mycolicibacterium thermoresistibile]
MTKFAKFLLLMAALALMPLGFSGAALAQPLTDEQIAATEDAIRPDGKYALVVSDARKLNVAVMTGRDFKAKSPGIEFQIVTYGDAAQAIATDPAVRETARRAVAEDGLKLVACAITFERMDLDAAMLPPEVPTTPNALTYVLGLQEQGYKTMTYA